MPAQNKRIYFAIEQVSLAPNGTATFSSNSRGANASNNGSGGLTLHGVQTVGINTRFLLEQVFELGQLAIYQNVEEIPEIEITLEKVLDGYCPMYCAATQGAASPTLAGRSATKAMFAMSIFSDVQDCASGVPLATVVGSGMFVQAVSYNCQVQGNQTESLTLIGNNKVFEGTPGGGGTYSFQGAFNNTDTPLSVFGVQRRQHVMFVPPSGSTKYTIIPTDVEGISGSGTNDINTGGADKGDYKAHIQSIKISANLGRTPLYELGRRAPYFRYVVFPVEVRTDIDVTSRLGDQVNALEEGKQANGGNLTEQTLTLKLQEGLYVDCGKKNKLLSVTYGGANAAGTRSGNAISTYSYITYNDFTVGHPEDVSNTGGTSWSGTF